MVASVEKAYAFIMTEQINESTYWSTRALSGERQWKILTEEDGVYVYYSSRYQDSNYEIVDNKGISSQDMSDAICLILEELGIKYSMWKIPRGWQIGAENHLDGIASLRSTWKAANE